MKRIVGFVSICLFLSASYLVSPYYAGATDEAANGKKQPTPEQMKQIMESTFGAMIPMMAKMTEVMIEVQLMEGEKPETAAKLAAFKKNLYDALIEQGFTKEEAFQIVLNTSLPTAAPTMK